MSKATITELDFREKWKHFPLNRDYLVSNLGNVISLKGTIPLLMSPTPNSGGYLQLGLRQYGKRTIYAVHQLVAMTFLPIPNHPCEVSHKNGNKKDNDVANLEWDTHLGNIHNDQSIRVKREPTTTGELKYYPSINSVTTDGFSVSAVFHRVKNKILTPYRGFYWKEVSNEEFQLSKLEGGVVHE